MSLLAYCVMEAAAAVNRPVAGVGGMPLEELQELELRCFFSPLESGEGLSRIPAVESAVAFHQVLQALFRQAALISFRFPAVLGNEEELRQYLRQHAPQYRQALSRLRHMVQMEVHVGRTGHPETSRPGSGREYLQQRQSSTAAQTAIGQRIRAATRPWVVEWRQRQAGEELRCYALLPREAVASFQDAVRGLDNPVAAARLSGPWPATEFFDLKDF